MVTTAPVRMLALTDLEGDCTPGFIRADNPHVGVAVTFSRFPTSYTDARLDMADAIRLRDWLTAVIDAAGPRPLHPAVSPFIELEESAILTPARRMYAERISDALYELDERRANEEQS